MASSRFIIPLLLAAGVDAHVQASLSAPKAQAFEVFAKQFQPLEYPNHPFVGNIPWYPYAIELGVGTPAQTQSLVLSLTHSDTFVLYNHLCNPSNDSDLAKYFRDCSSGAFDDETSSTSTYNSSDIYLTDYVGVYVEGVMMQDVLRIDAAEMRNASLGIAIYTYVDTGFFGLSTPWGYPGGYLFEDRTAILDQMANQKVIDSPVFSIYAERGNGTTGVILFGAVDKSKYEGKLQRIQASAGRDKFAPESFGGKASFVPGYFANVSAVWWSESSDEEVIQYVNSSRGGTFYATVDPTFTFTNVPSYVADPIYRMNPNVAIWHNIGLRTVECSRASSLNGSFTLELGGEGGYRLTANLRDLVVPAEQWHLLRPSEKDATEYSKHCLLGIQSTEHFDTFYYDSSGATTWVIGSMALKNTYLAFDSKNMEVSLAPLSKRSDGKQDIVSFESLGAHAPDSEFVGYEECFGDNCDTGKDGEPDAGANIVLQRGLLIASVLGGMGLIFLG